MKEMPSITKLREDMQSDDWATRTAAETVYGLYCEALRAQLVCPECGFAWTYHDDGCCPNDEQQATIMKGRG